MVMNVPQETGVPQVEARSGVSPSQACMQLIRDRQFVRAEKLLKESLQQLPNDVVLLNMLAGVYVQTERLPLAIEVLQGILVLQPDHDSAVQNLLSLYVYTAQTDAALALIDRVAARATSVETLKFLCAHCGHLCDASKNYYVGIRAHRRLVGMLPTESSCYSTLANYYYKAGLMEMTLQMMYEAYQLAPHLPSSYNNLAVAQFENKHFHDAVATLDNAVAQFPANLHLRTDNIFFSLSGLCLNGINEKIAAALGQIYAYHEQIERGVAQIFPPVATPAPILDAFCFLFPQQISAADQKKIGRVLGHSWATVQPMELPARPKPINRPLRIGYVSADFRPHATMFLFADVLQKHRKQHFQIYTYALGQEDSSEFSKNALSSVFAHKQVESRSDREIAEMIVQDGIDILVDLKGYTRFSRSGIFAARPAPIIVNWLGYPGTMGDSRLADYIIGDAVVTPIQAAGDFSETIAQMPVCYQPNSRNRSIPPAASRAQWRLPEDKIVLCSFNAPFKLTSAVFDCWSHLLHVLPNTVLWLMELSRYENHRLLQQFTNRGVDQQRIIFTHHCPPEEHLSRLACADLALDTFPCTSHTTASDALWMGVPLVTCIGQTFASRVAASVLNAANCPQLVTNSHQEYINKVIELVNNPGELQAIRQHLLNNRHTLPLFDSAQFTTDLEMLYLKMWSDFQDGVKRVILASGAARH